MSRAGRATLLVLSVLATATTVAALNAHSTQQWVGQQQIQPSASPPFDEQVPSTQHGQEPSKNILRCPSNIQNVLLSTGEEFEALVGTDISLSPLQYCPLFNNPIFHNHPATNSLVDRLLIYVSHQLREHPTSHVSDDSGTKEWLFFLPPSSISAHTPVSMSDLPEFIATNLESAHLILRAPEQASSAFNPQDQRHQQPLPPPEALPRPHPPPTNILAIRISQLSKALLERALILQQRQTPHARLTENEALALAATEYDFADSVVVSIPTLLP